MKWKVIGINNVDSIYKLPRKIGLKKDNRDRIVYEFDYVSQLSGKTKRSSFPFANVLTEIGSNRISSVLLEPGVVEGDDANRRMLNAICSYFGLDGRIDADEQKFLDTIESEVVRPQVFAK